MNAHLGRRLRRTTLLTGLVAALSGLVGAAGLAGPVGVSTGSGGLGEGHLYTALSGERPLHPSPVGAGEGAILYAGHPDAIAGRYVVVLRDRAGVAADTLATRYGGTVRFPYRAALNGFAVEADAAQARRMAADPAVAYVAQDRTVTVADDLKAAAATAGPGMGVTVVPVQPNPPSWGLDRIDQRSRPLDLKYHYPNTGSRVKAYIIGTGIRYTHQEFGGRAVLGVDTVGDGQNGNDCQGSGTFISGVTGGSTVGVAKAVKLISVRVLNCAGSGTFSQVIAGVDWITSDALATRAISVANMSLGGGAYQPLDDAVTRSIAANVHYSVAAGGSAADACNFSPARVPRATTVGATDINDNRARSPASAPAWTCSRPA